MTNEFSEFDDAVPSSWLMTVGSAERQGCEEAERRFGPKMVPNPRWSEDRSEDPVIYPTISRTTENGAVVDEPWDYEHGVRLGAILEARRRFGDRAVSTHPKPDPPGYIPSASGVSQGQREAERRFGPRLTDD